MNLQSLAMTGSLAFALGCGGGAPPPTMEGRQGMLSRTAVAEKCEEAAKEHDRPFVVEWDATDLASFEARAAQQTLVVRYEGCKMKVLYECSDTLNPAAFGRYGQPMLTSGTVQGFDVKNEGELYAQLPLGAARLAGRLEAGEALHLKYFVSGVATTSRDSLYRGDLSRYPGCREATHFVWGYNLGAFELSSSSRAASSGEVGYLGAGAGGNRKQEESQVTSGGAIASCSTQDQRACRVPIRLALRSITDGVAPAGPLVPTLPPGGGDTPNVGLPRDVQEQIAVAQNVAAAREDASKKIYELRDGVGCLKSVERVMQLDPRQADNDGFKQMRARCLMAAGQCDEGTKDLRAVFAAADVKRIKSDDALDSEVRADANRWCPSGTARNDVDFVERASREMTELVKANDGKGCRAKADEVLGRIGKLDRKSSDAQARHRGISALEQASFCIAGATSCEEGLKLWKKKYALQLPNMSGIDKTATESWGRLVEQKRVVCK